MTNSKNRFKVGLQHRIKFDSQRTKVVYYYDLHLPKYLTSHWIWSFLRRWIRAYSTTVKAAKSYSLKRRIFVGSKA